MKNKKSEGASLSEKLSFNLKSCWENLSSKEKTEINHFSENYKKFIDTGRTSYLFIDNCVSILNKHKFLDINEYGKNNKTAKPGERFYQTVKDKSLFFTVIGKQPLSNGVNIICAHCDSPHIGLKTNPLYENSGLSYLDTHYYGGIKYYQWAALPLAMYGVLYGENNKKINIQIGNNANDPVFTITDLLPHLAADQMKKTAGDFIDAEGLDILVGSEPYKDEKIPDRVKLNILNILNKKYGIVEKSFANAEISFLPAFNARDVGFDSSMIGANGHDDKSCTYAALQAVLHFAVPEKTIICLFIDKEEVFGYRPYIQQFKHFIQLLNKKGIDPYDILRMSSVISADVNAAYDPNYSDVYDVRTASYLGKGIAISKSGTGNFAEMDFCQKIQNIFEKNKIQWQYGGLGKPGKGGAGTIASDMAELTMDTLDCGIPVLSMHSPFEIISKVDLWTAYKAYRAFFQDNK